MITEKKLADMDKYRRTTQLDFAVEALRAAILSGEMKMGERVNEVAVTNRLNISRTTFREALRQMEEAGLLIREPFKGTFVREFTDKEIKEINDLQGALECHAVELILEKGKNKKKDMKPLYKIVSQMESMDSKCSQEEHNELHIEFHRNLVLLSDNQLLYRVWNDLSQQFRVAMAVSQGIYQMSGETVNFAKNHREIADAILEGDREKAQRRIKEHVTNSEKQESNRQ